MRVVELKSKLDTYVLEKKRKNASQPLYIQNVCLQTNTFNYVSRVPGSPHRGDSTGFMWLSHSQLVTLKAPRGRVPDSRTFKVGGGYREYSDETRAGLGKFLTASCWQAVLINLQVTDFFGLPK